MIQPPTDNLYKFMAILGLILWVGGALFPWTKAYELEKELISLEAQVEYSQANLSKTNALELTVKTKQMRLMYRATVAYMVFGVISFFIGGYLMYFGFKFWYLRVQKSLDKQLSGKE